MKRLLRFYSLVLGLYPLHFRTRFGAEMEEVFRTGLEEAIEQGVLASYILRELIRLPASLASVYVWSMRAGEGKPVPVSNLAGGGNTGVNLQGEGWGSSFLSGLPHLLVGIMIISSTLGEAKILTSLTLQTIIFSIILLGVIIYSIVKGWKRWSGGWVFYIFFLLLVLLNRGLNLLSISTDGNADWLFNLSQLLLLPLLLAYLLYKITCKDRLRGLLAAIPPMVVLWIFFLEFVPAIDKSIAWAVISLLAFIASAFMLQTKHFLFALGLAMAVPLLGGFPFAYLGVYKGGTLPFSQPGPNLPEVFRQYIPFLVVVFAIVLGPQLAAKLRIIGNKAAKTGGKIFYRLALGGILLGLVWALLHGITVISNTHTSKIILQVIVIAAALLYLAGFALLARGIYLDKSQESDHGRLFELGGLFLPLLFVPIPILLIFPVLNANTGESWLVPLAEVAWVLASILVVKD